MKSLSIAAIANVIFNELLDCYVNFGTSHTLDERPFIFRFEKVAQDYTQSNGCLNGA